MKREKAITLEGIEAHEFRGSRGTPELCAICWHGPGFQLHRTQEQAAETIDRTLPREVGS